MNNGTSLVLTASQIEELSRVMGDGPDPVRIIFWENGFEGRGMYAFSIDHPEEGAVFLGKDVTP